MGQTFDPYHKWLGIPPEEQPPNYYRLLGIRVFEGDPDVIESAADQRMVHLRRYQTGRHAEWSQRLLNEISAARICLLNASKRSAYDEQLKLSLPRKSAAVLLVAAPLPPAPPTDLAFPVVDEAWSPRTTSRRTVRHKPSSGLGPIIGGALAVVLLAAAIAAWLLASREAPPAAAPPSAMPDAPRSRQDDKPSATHPPAPPKKIAPPPKPRTDSGPKRARPPSSPRKDKAVLKVDAGPADPSAGAPGATGYSSESEWDAVDRQSPRRPALPSAAEQEAAIKLARDLYKDDFARAKTPQSRQELANMLLEEAEQQADGESIAALALLRLAREMAVGAGDGLTAFRAIDAAAERFEIDAAALKSDALAELAKKARTPEQHASVAETAAEVLEDAAATGNFSLAAKLAKLGVAEGGKGRDKELVVSARGRLQELNAALKTVAEFETAKAALADRPDDPDANSTAASYYCFLIGDWAKGLPHLAKGKDAALKSLARRELEAAPREPAERVELADAWWELAQAADGKRKETMLQHAGSWYAKAEPSLPAGMIKLKVEKRLAEIERLERRSNAPALPEL